MTKSNPKSERNIKRIDKNGHGGGGGTHGFQVYFKRDGVEFTRLFSDTKYGGEEGALRAAQQFRDKAQARIPPKKDPRASQRAMLSKDDKEDVRRIYMRLLALGCQPWLDNESLLPGQDWDSEIRKAIREAHVFLVCLSSRSVTKRGYVQKEIKFALDAATEISEGEIFIIPIKLEPCELPPSLSKWQWLEAYKDGYARLIASLAQQTEKLGLDHLRVG